jgi:hypothetical protein
MTPFPADLAGMHKMQKIRRYKLQGGTCLRQAGPGFAGLKSDTYILRKMAPFPADPAGMHKTQKGCRYK